RASASGRAAILARIVVSPDTVVIATSSSSGDASARASARASSTSVPMSVSRTIRRGMGLPLRRPWRTRNASARTSRSWHGAPERRLDMREIVDGIVTWAWHSEPHGYDFNGWFVRHPGGNLCIDPVEPSAEALDLLAREGVARILLTNRNHVRAANLIPE